MTDEKAREMMTTARRADTLIKSRDNARAAAAAMKRYAAKGAQSFRFYIVPIGENGEQTYRSDISVTLAADVAAKEWGAFLRALASRAQADLDAL